MSETQPIKLALSINKDFDPSTVSMSELITKPVFLAQRPECETDESAVQLIPYITLVDGSGKDLKFFVYTRGKASGEQRLAGKCSVGLGGHIESIVSDYNVSGSILISDNEVVNSIADAAVREVQEEIGLDVPFHIFANAIKEDYLYPNKETSNELYFEKAKLLYYTMTPTDIVHLGISFVLKAKPSDIKNLELDVITRGKWMTYLEIEEAERGDNPINLEVWSKVVIARVNMRKASDNNY